MMSIAALSFLAGAVLAQQSKLLGLIRVMLLLQVATIAVGILRADAGTIALAVVAVTVGLQVGYLAGALAQSAGEHIRDKALLRSPPTTQRRPNQGRLFATAHDGHRRKAKRPGHND